MPVKDNIQSENPIQNEEEKRRKAVQNVSEVKTQKLLPFLNMKAEFHQSRIDTLDEKIAARQDKIARNEAKIEKLSAKADMLEDKNKILKAAIGNLPGIKQIIEANERKIKAIREEKIPKRQQKCAVHKKRIEKLTQKKNIIGHKLDRVTALNNVVRSFSIGFNKERREVFSNAMDKLNQASVNCLNDKKNALETRKSSLLLTYVMPETSAVDKFNIQDKISDINGKIEALENKIHKIARPECYHAGQSNDMTDAAMKVTEDKLTEMTEKDKLSMSDISDGVITEVQSLESKDKSEITHIAENYLKNTEMALEDDYNSIDGIINNGSKEENTKINPDYYKMLPKENRSISVETAGVGKKVMKRLEDKGIPYSAVERKNNAVAITVSKADEQAYKSISDNVKAERAVQFVNPDFYRSLPKEERFTQRMPQKQAEEKIAELSQKGIPHSAVLNGEKSAVTVEKKDTGIAYMSRESLKRQAQRISRKGRENSQAKTKKQGLEQG